MSRDGVDFSDINSGSPIAQAYRLIAEGNAREAMEVLFDAYRDDYSLQPPELEIRLRKLLAEGRNNAR